MWGGSLAKGPCAPIATTNEEIPEIRQHRVPKTIHAIKHQYILLWLSSDNARITKVTTNPTAREPNPLMTRSGLKMRIPDIALLISQKVGL